MPTPPRPPRKSLFRYSVVRIADTIDDTLAPTVIATLIANKTDITTQENLQSAILSQMRRMIWGPAGHTWFEDFDGAGIPSLHHVSEVTSALSGRIDTLDTGLSNLSDDVLALAGGDRAVIGETPIGSIDGVNRIFHTAHTYAHAVGGISVRVYLNGVRQSPDGDYTVPQPDSPNSILFVDAPRTGDHVLVDYVRS